MRVRLLLKSQKGESKRELQSFEAYRKREITQAPELVCPNDGRKITCPEGVSCNLLMCVSVLMHTLTRSVCPNDGHTA
jgi:hypothetical protein